jgi:hypothetical protein
MFGFDSYIHLQYVESIISENHITELSIAKSYYDFVGFHVFASAISLLTGLPADVIYEFVSIVIPILIFDLTIIAFIHHVDKKKKVSLVLLYPSLIGIQMFLGRPNTLGISLFSLCLYLYLCKPESFRAQIIAGFLAIATVKVHHLSAVFLLPVIFFTSIFLAENYRSILSLVYAIPVVVIVDTILNSREFSIVNLYFTENETYSTLYNVFIKNTFSLLVLWVIITLIGFIIRRVFARRVKIFISSNLRKKSSSDVSSTRIQRFAKFSVVFLVIGIIILEVVGIFNYTANLTSWYISVELVIIFLLSGAALIKPDKVKYSLFIIGFFFYGITVVFSLAFSSAEHELSWVAPRTFIFTIIFISLLAFLAISGFLKQLRKRWLTIFIALLLVNSYFSMKYMDDQYLPGYNLKNNYQNMTFAYSIDTGLNMTTVTISMPFSISKFIKGVDIYRIPLLIDANLSLEENANFISNPFLNIRYIVFSEIMDQWLGTPIFLSADEITYYLNKLYLNSPTFNLILSNGKNFLLYRYR